MAVGPEKALSPAALASTHTTCHVVLYFVARIIGKSTFGPIDGFSILAAPNTGKKYGTERDRKSDYIDQFRPNDRGGRMEKRYFMSVRKLGGPQMKKLIISPIVALIVVTWSIQAQAGKPIVTPQSAESVTATSATLAAFVNTNGTVPTTVEFEYGTTTAYGTTVAFPSALTINANWPVGIPVIGLKPGQTYHFRANATNSDGTTNGADRTFTTLAAAPTAATQPADLVSGFSATLKGSVNANGASTTVVFEYGTTTAYGSQVVAAQSPVSGNTDTAVSAVLVGLSPATTYHFRVRASNSVDTTNGADQTFTTAASAPSATTDTAEFVDAKSAVLFGFVNPKGAETAVVFEYGTTTDYGREIVAANSPLNFLLTINQPVFAFLSRLTPNTRYHFRVKAINSEGTAFGGDATFTTEVMAMPWIPLLLLDD